MIVFLPLILISSTIPLVEEIIILDKDYGLEAYEAVDHETSWTNSDGFVREWVDRFSPMTTIESNKKD